MPANFVIEVHIPELSDLADAIRARASAKPETPRPTTPAQTAQPTRQAFVPAQAAPTVVPTAPISPTQAYSIAPTTPQPPVYPSNPQPAAPGYRPQQTVPLAGPTPAAPITPTYPNLMMGAVNSAPVAAPVPSQPAPIAPSINAPQPVAPVATVPTYSQEDIARAAGTLVDVGKRQEVCDLITKTFGVQALQQIPKEKYGAFATALRGLGARI